MYVENNIGKTIKKYVPTTIQTRIATYDTTCVSPIIRKWNGGKLSKHEM